MSGVAAVLMLLMSAVYTLGVLLSVHVKSALPALATARTKFRPAVIEKLLVIDVLPPSVSDVVLFSVGTAPLMVYSDDSKVLHDQLGDLQAMALTVLVVLTLNPVE